MRAVGELTKDEIKRAIGNYIAEHGPTPAYQLAFPVAKALGADVNNVASLGTREGDLRSERQAQERFYGKVYRIANEMAGDGELIKVGKGEIRPNGARSHKASYYYTLSHWDAEAADLAAKHAGIEERRKRWASVQRRLWSTYGIQLNDQHRITLEDWDKILGEES